MGASDETNYRTLANALPEIIWTTDAHGRLEWVNDRWVELTGLTREASLRDKGALAAVHPDDREELGRRFANAVAISTPCELEYRIRTREGNYRFHLCRVVPVRDAHGVITRWVASAFDMEERREAEERLRTSERRFETVFHAHPQPAAITRLADGVFLTVNEALLRMAGRTREEVLGKTAADIGLWKATDRAAFLASLAETGTADLEVSTQPSHGHPHTLKLLSARIDFDGEPCIVTVATDVTASRASEAALRDSEARARARADELAALMDAVPAVVWISRDPECRDVRGNRAGREMLRMPEDQNISKTAADPGPTRHFRVFTSAGETPPEELPVQRAARGVEVRNHEEEVRFDDGQVVQLYGSAIPLRDPTGAPRGSIGAFVDVTRLKQAEAALREADRRKDEFLALLSHELRNPLAPILTAAELMQLRGDVATPREREVIVRQAKHLVRLVDDLLDVSRVARGKVTLSKRPVELAAVVAKAVEAAGPLLEQRRHALHVAVPPDRLTVEGDEVRLTQVVSNLLTNAARYTPPGGRIDVTGARERNEVVLRVRDNGTGIDPALLPQVFEMFVQGTRGPDRAEGGLGLGLSLVRTLTALHGGTVSAHSQGLDRGSEFTVRLPTAALSAIAPPSADGPGRLTPGDGGERILVVDDNRDAAEMISGVLGRAGHEVRIAGDASQALSMADSFRPEVAILDIGLPVMDGYTLGRELRARLGEGTPILIALTGYGQEQDQRRSEEAGFSFHLVKPVDAERLTEIVGTLAARAR